MEVLVFKLLESDYMYAANPTNLPLSTDLQLKLLRQLFNIACAIHLFAEHVGGPSTVSTLFRLGESYHNSELDDRYLDDANSCQ